MAFTVILDANVLYSLLLRDLLIRISQTGLFRARWTNEIQHEWINALLKKRPDLDREKLDRTRDLMDRAIPDCLVEGYETLITELKLPDANDRHVLAAAIRVDADMIVTFNIKDFPQGYLDTFHIEVQHPDDFLLCQVDLNQSAVRHAVQQQLLAMKKPTLSSTEYLEKLEVNGLTKTASRFRQLGIDIPVLETKASDGKTIH